VRGEEAHRQGQDGGEDRCHQADGDRLHHRTGLEAADFFSGFGQPQPHAPVWRVRRHHTPKNIQYILAGSHHLAGVASGDPVAGMGEQAVERAGALEAVLYDHSQIRVYKIAHHQSRVVDACHQAVKFDIRYRPGDDIQNNCHKQNARQNLRRFPPAEQAGVVDVPEPE